MSDIVERLRSYRPYRFGEGDWFGPKVCEEAADTITALRAEVERLREALEPFAFLADKIRPDDPDNDRPAFARNLDYPRARAALSSITGDE